MFILRFLYNNSNNDNNYYYTYTNSTTNNENNDWWFFNQTSFNNDVSENLHPASDVDVNGVLTSAVFNAVVFVVFMVSYEGLRRIFPNVYASRQTKERRMELAAKQNDNNDDHSYREGISPSSSNINNDDDDDGNDGNGNGLMKTVTEDKVEDPDLALDPDTFQSNIGTPIHRKRKRAEKESHKLPDVYKSEIPFEWIKPVFNVSWRQVRELCGLDAYFYLRYIRMGLKVTSVSALWSTLILFPVYASGQNGAVGWYFFSMANVSQGSPIIWVSVVFLYLFSGFVLFVIKQEYKHFVELRLDFLGKGDSTDPQHHYSVMVENIPKELRSDSALYSYFDKLFPGKVHSANIILRVPELEALSRRKLRVTRRLEKSIAHFEATGIRPTHITGRCRTMICGIESTPVKLCCDSRKMVDTFDDEDEDFTRRGVRVDSIDYYTHDLQRMNSAMMVLQQEKIDISAYGNISLTGNQWFDSISQYADMFFEEELSDSDGSIDKSYHDEFDDDFSLDSLSSLRIYNGKSPKKPSSRSLNTEQSKIDQAELGVTGVAHSSERKFDHLMYGSVEDRNDGISHSQSINSLERNHKLAGSVKKSLSFERKFHKALSYESKKEPLLSRDTPSKSVKFSENIVTPPRLQRQISKEEENDESGENDFNPLNGSFTMATNRKISKLAGRLGFDFVIYMMKLVGRRYRSGFGSASDDVMSSTGFVTFLDLRTVTNVASTPLTHKPKTMNVKVAPEPRDILWDNCSNQASVNERRSTYANISLMLGAILWSIPLASIQALASADQIAKIPGMEWISDLYNGRLKTLINAYLPVIALLTLILILPIIFQAIAVYFEKRKTQSDVNRSVVSRYFYYQLANIYISVTAGSIWLSAAEIIQRPSAGLEILGNSLPTVVGYFIALLVTKILGGLPMVILRVGALSRYLMLRLLYRTKFLTQRELESVYLVEPLYYGWEYPTQMLVIVICFTYACISPSILIFGAMYFFAALMVYKKQVLYVYTPRYESGGDLFPLVCDRTILGLVCGQLTFMGYCGVRGGHIFQVLSILPLITFTFGTMKFFRHHYNNPSRRLTLELACELDNKWENISSSTINDSFRKASLRPQETFDVNFYKQPVMTEGLGEPMYYRMGKSDKLTGIAKTKIRSNRLQIWQSKKNTTESKRTLV